MAKKAKEPKGEKAPKKEKVKAPVKGRMLDRATNLTVVLFAVSLVAEKVLSG